MATRTPFSLSFFCFVSLLTLANVAFAQEEERVWTVDEILNEGLKPKVVPPINYCQGRRFKPCVCWEDVNRDIRYRPSVKECGGRAAAILSGKYRDVFSIVVRDNQNRDRWPATGNFGGCSQAERDLGLSKCSAFKTQKRIAVQGGEDNLAAVVHCFGASGYAKLFKNAVRLTIKIADDPGSSSDPLARLCLRRGDLPLN